MSLGLGLGLNITGRRDPDAAIVSMFANDEQGAWYDNSDLSTMFADSAGTTPATVNGSVGLQLDKSRGLVRGPELVTNGDLSNGLTGWTVWNTVTPLSLSSGQVVATADDASQYGPVAPPVATVIGKYYEVSADYVGGTGPGANGMQFRIGGFGGDSSALITPALPGFGTKTCIFRATSATTYICLASNGSGVAGDTIAVDNISVREIPGNHRYQLTPANEPVLRGTPTGANVVANGTFDTDTANWTALSATLASVSGELRITPTITGGSGGYQAFSTVVGRTYRVRVGTAYRGTSTDVLIQAKTTTTPGGLLLGQAGVSSTTPTSYEIIFVATTTTSNLFFRVGDTGTAFFDDVEFHDVSADAVQAPYFLHYDGVDDYLVTNAVDFTGTDKMTVVAGVKTGADTTGMLVELSPIANNNDGSFYISVPESGGGGGIFGFRLRGTTVGSYNTAAKGVPFTGVIAAQMDIGAAAVASELIPRINGIVDQTVPGGVAGIGNFGNHALYFGTRAGTSLFFNGREYQMVIRGAATASSTLSNVERRIATKTGISL